MPIKDIIIKIYNVPPHQGEEKGDPLEFHSKPDTDIQEEHINKDGNIISRNCKNLDGRLYAKALENNKSYYDEETKTPKQPIPFPINVNDREEVTFWLSCRGENYIFREKYKSVIEVDCQKDITNK